MMTRGLEEIDARYVLNNPPDLTSDIAASHWRELNVLLHSIALLGEDLRGRRPLLSLLRTSKSIVPADAGLLYLWDPCRGTRVTTTLCSARELPRPKLRAQNIQARACLKWGKPVLVNDPVEPVLRDELASLGARAALSVPITFQGNPWSALQLLRNRPFLREEAVLLWLFALTLEGALSTLIDPMENRELIPQTETGSGLMTLERFRNRLAWELKRSGWVERPLTVASIRVREKAGGTVRGRSGQITATEAARVLRQTLGQHEPMTRLERRHFVAALPDTGIRDAKKMIDEAREALLKRANGGNESVGIVTGFATFPDDGNSESEMIGTACARSNGRRRSD